MSVQKSVNLTERVQLQFGAEATNVLNHTEYVSIPGPTINNYLGSTNTDAASRPLGLGTNGSFGTFGEQTYDPRQVVLFANIRF